MDSRKDRLLDLRDEVYHAEDVIDGCYNPDNIEDSDLVEINKRYKELLVDMNDLFALLEREIEKS
jgi:hypothetical protein